MKKAAALLLVTTLCMLSVWPVSLAQEAGDDRYAAILRAWNAANGDELWYNVWERYIAQYDEYMEPTPLRIRFGGDTEALIRDKKKWDLAIVSSKDVDLQKLADKELLMKRGHVPGQYVASSQWLYPEQVQKLLPDDPIWIYHVYCYDYDPQTDDATLLICHPGTIHDMNDSNLCAEIMLEARTADQIRATEGIARAVWTDWTAEELLARPDDWDVASIAIKSEDELNALDQAGLLYDFSNDPYWPARNKLWEVPNGLFSADGRMIAVPYAQYAALAPDSTLVIVVNARCADLSRAMAYEKHWMRSYEWMYDRAVNDDIPSEHRKKYGVSLFKDEMDW